MSALLDFRLGLSPRPTHRRPEALRWTRPRPKPKRDCRERSRSCVPEIFDSLRFKDGKPLFIAGQLAFSEDCCCGVCDLCGDIPTPGTLIVRNLKLLSIYELQEAVGTHLPTYTVEEWLCGQAFGLPGGPHPDDYLCWQVWATEDGCARCNLFSEADIKVKQPIGYFDPVCDGNTNDCLNPTSCEEYQANCCWHHIEFVCDEEMNFHTWEDADCCGQQFQTPPGAGAIYPGCSGTAVSGARHSCLGFNPMNFCEFGGVADPDFDPFSTAQTCDCDNGCDFGSGSGCQGKTTCGQGCCYFQHWWEVSIVQFGEDYQVNLGIGQNRLWYPNGPQVFENTAINFSRVITADQWDCLQTPIDFTCEDITQYTGWAFCPHWEFEHPEACLYDGLCVGDSEELEDPDDCNHVVLASVRRAA